MQKVNVSFELDPSRLPELEAFLNGGSAPAKKGRAAKAPVVDDDEDFLGGDGDDEDDDENTIDLDLIREEIAKRAKAGKKEQLEKLIKGKYKLKNVSGLPEEKFEAFYADLLKIKIK